MRLQPCLALTLLVGMRGVDAHVQEGEFDGGAQEDEGSRGPSSVYVMEHGFLGKTTEWMPRGTLLLSGSPGTEKKQGSFEARLSDAKEFVQLRPDLQGLMA